MEIKTKGTGFIEEVEGLVYNIPAFDPRIGNHFWIIVIAYKWNPATVGQAILDHETLVATNPPVCAYCEQIYSPMLNMRRCKGRA